MGCIASAGQPDRKACVVVARQAVVPALLSECLMLCTNGNLWCIQNSMGTFEVAAPDTHHPKVGMTHAKSLLTCQGCQRSAFCPSARLIGLSP
jgi:hypothetical protein